MPRKKGAKKKPPARSRKTRVVKKRKPAQRGDGFLQDTYDVISRNKKKILAGLLLGGLAYSANQKRKNRTEQSFEQMSSVFSPIVTDYGNAYGKIYDDILNQGDRGQHWAPIRPPPRIEMVYGGYK
jgi:hypothetical protein